MDHQQIFKNSVGTSATELARGLNTSEMVDSWLVVVLIKISSRYGIRDRHQIRVLGCAVRFSRLCGTSKDHLILVWII